MLSAFVTIYLGIILIEGGVGLLIGFSCWLSLIVLFVIYMSSRCEPVSWDSRAFLD
jgi:hypothetical protein